MHMRISKDFVVPRFEVFGVRPVDVICTSIPGYDDGGDIEYEEE